MLWDILETLPLFLIGLQCRSRFSVGFNAQWISIFSKLSGNVGQWQKDDFEAHLEENVGILEKNKRAYIYHVFHKSFRLKYNHIHDHILPLAYNKEQFIYEIRVIFICFFPTHEIKMPQSLRHRLLLLVGSAFSWLHPIVSLCLSFAHENKETSELLWRYMCMPYICPLVAPSIDTLVVVIAGASGWGAKLDDENC